MMKMLTCAVVGMTMLGLLAGCSKEQKVVIAKQLGSASAVTWIGMDNPSQREIATVKQVMTIVKTVCATNSSGIISYMDSVYPVAEKYINEKVKPEEQAMAKLGVAFFLTSLDTAFAMNPDWRQNQEDVSAIAGAYVDGFIFGLDIMPTGKNLSGGVSAIAEKHIKIRKQIKNIK